MLAIEQCRIVHVALWVETKYDKYRSNNYGIGKNALKSSEGFEDGQFHLERFFSSFQRERVPKLMLCKLVSKVLT